MTAKAPEGPKADHGPEDASKGYIPRPPSAVDLDRISEAQALITDEWAGESPQKGEDLEQGAHPGAKPGKT
ncbi:hypothetical protein [Roseomonas xinghualingensis]|uniref:hypothetical protein n=1 Tax=Roseomonas xinghualingensis TaxID=2986475 RepID=UPI0021F13EC6|nr:hypothetical protein [Roseomonas sp. SXEYE001]MCV4206505.1 hypothetical protein [Roseomonas sp. SXEYE001]